MARHTLRSLLRTRIFWGILIFAVLASSTMGYFVPRAMIMRTAFGEGMHDELEDAEDVGKYLFGKKGPSRKEVENMDIPFGEMGGCGPSGMPGSSLFSTPLVAAIHYFGFLMMAFFSNIASIFLMMGLLPNELDKRSIYTLISKPLSRTDIFFGKLFGGWAALFMFNFILGFIIAIFFYLAGAPFKAKFLLVCIISGISPMMFGTLVFVLGTLFRNIGVGFIAIVALFFSTTAGNAIIFGIGELLKWDDLTNFVLTYLPPLAKIKVLVTAFIDFNLFEMIIGLMMDAGFSKVYEEWWQNALFVAAYFAALILIGWGVFRQKEFN